MSDTKRLFVDWHIANSDGLPQKSDIGLHYEYAIYKAGFERAWEASRAQALSEAQKEIDELKSEIACYEKYGLPHNPNGN